LVAAVVSEKLKLHAAKAGGILLGCCGGGEKLKLHAAKAGGILFGAGLTKLNVLEFCSRSRYHPIQSEA